MTHCHAMFVVTEAEAEAIRRALEEGGERAAVIALRRHFPGIRDNADAGLLARTIAGWKPLSTPPGAPPGRRARQSQ